jgi:hypothetical protein
MMKIGASIEKVVWRYYTRVKISQPGETGPLTDTTRYPKLIDIYKAMYLKAIWCYEFTYYL